MSKVYYSGLDALRFGAAMMVCVFHLGFYSWASFGSTTAEALDHVVAFDRLTPFSWFGWVGVEIFFVISGFVIANSANGASPAEFLRGRMLRLYPAAWICATLTLIAIAVFGHHPAGGQIAPYLRAMALWPRGPWVDGAYWTLAVEISFYALVFLTLVFRRFGLLPWVAGILTAVSVLYIAAHILALLKFMPDFDLLRRLGGLGDNLLLRHGMFFALGIWLWMMSRQRMSAIAWAAAALAVAGGCAEVWSRGLEIETLEARSAIAQSALIPVAIWLLAIAAMVMMVRAPGRFTPKTQRTRDALRHLGLATYPLYLLQNVFGASLMHGLVDAGLPGYVSLVAAISIVLAGAFAVALLAEPAVRGVLKSVLSATGRWAAGIRPFGFMFRPSDTI
ncbi:MAG: acyltransferase [Hyphomonadaceae bacterium]